MHFPVLAIIWTQDPPWRTSCGATTALHFGKITCLLPLGKGSDVIRHATGRGVDLAIVSSNRCHPAQFDRAPNAEQPLNQQ